MPASRKPVLCFIAHLIYITRKQNFHYPKKDIFANPSLKMSALSPQYEKILLEKLRTGDKAAFTVIFTGYYSDLVRFSYTFSKNQSISEEIVQEVFLDMWEKRDRLAILTSLKSYLLKTVQNRSIDWLRHAGVERRYNSKLLLKPGMQENETEKYVLHSELNSHLIKAIKKIPPEYAEVYMLSRNEMLSYSEISERLGIPERTVKERISKALAALRGELKEFLTVLVIYFISLIR
jgi:RNA polymerase sigma-70 factor (family 1)